MASKLLVIFGCTLFISLSLQYPTYQDDDYLQLLSQWEKAQQAKGGLAGGSADLLDVLYEDQYPVDYRTWALAQLEKEFLGNDPLFLQQLEEEYEEEEEEPTLSAGDLVVVDQWPDAGVDLGEVGGVTTDNNGDPIVFRRGERKFEDSFSGIDSRVFKKELGKIEEPTILKLSQKDGTIISQFGENMFYLPHGITTDDDDNIWVTDVGAHQVFKFEAGATTPSLTLGKELEFANGNDDKERFCKPTDVAVTKSGDFFVADGYCNSRIMKFNKDGVLTTIFGENDAEIPHSLALLEDKDLICVADREDMRILCYNAGIEDASKTGTPEREYTDYNMGKVYSIAYSPLDGLLYAVTGPTDDLIPYGNGFTIDINADPEMAYIATWSPHGQGFGVAHDVTVSPEGTAVYVGEVEPGVVFKFEVYEPEADEEDMFNENENEVEESADKDSVEDVEDELEEVEKEHTEVVDENGEKLIEEEEGLEDLAEEDNEVVSKEESEEAKE